ncbi:MAG TPA: protein kinase [Holophaga sp.]|nr:protein kinase [Holophaga sp.]HPS68450.1 protein kinase [Holophaga sp.]
MVLASGTALGPYQVLRLLGSGGMGEVYAAADPRLGREVAIKVLTMNLGRDAESQKRFQQEALAVAALNHPNIVQIYDVGAAEDGAPYLVMELLDGESLRGRMGGRPMPVRKVAEIAIQMARALGVAHAKGIVHRDLKPENVHLTRQGLVKILDFGLAKLARPAAEGTSEEATRAMHTQAGMVLGTVGYMAPEQVQGQPVDARADIFALGVVMWEMLSGSHPFRGDSAIDTMHAILREDPPEIAPALGLPPEMERLLRRCLEKNPDDRFQSARDLSFQLESLAEASTASRTRAAAGGGEGGRPWYRTPHKLFYPLPIRLPQRLRVCFWDRVQLSAAYLLLAGLLAAALLATHRGGALGLLGHAELDEKYEPAAELAGALQSAAISRDGRHAAFSVSDGPGAVRLLYREGDDIRAVREVENPPASEVLAVADTGTALLKDAEGSLFQVELGRDASAMQVATKVSEADLTPDGTKIALLRAGEGGYVVEFPAGRVCYSSRQRIRDLKVSPQGDALAFFEQEAGRFFYHLKCWRADGTVESWRGGGPLSPRGGFFEGSLRGLAWNAEGNGLFVATQGNLIGLLTRTGERALHRNAGQLRIHGASREGLLLEVGTEVIATRGRLAGSEREQDLAWTGGTLEGVSEDGSQLLISREDEIWVLPADRSKGRKVGVGQVEAFSSDGKVILYSDAERVYGVPSRGGDLRTLVTAEELKALGLPFGGGQGLSARFVVSGDDRWVLVHAGAVLARKPLDGTGRLERVALPTGGRILSAASPDGTRIALQVREGNEGNWFTTLDIASGKEAGRVPAEKTERLMGWIPASGFLVFSTLDGKGELRRVDPKGQRKLLRTLEPPATSASGRFRTVRVPGDGACYSYRYYTPGTSQLLLGKGL